MNRGKQTQPNTQRDGYRSIFVFIHRNDKQKLARAFNSICARFRPAFRYFFYENFTTPGTHFERRLAYTKVC